MSAGVNIAASSKLQLAARSREHFNLNAFKAAGLQNSCLEVVKLVVHVDFPLPN